jgi:hypothetical protein
MSEDFVLIKQTHTRLTKQEKTKKEKRKKEEAYVC